VSQQTGQQNPEANGHNAMMNIYDLGRMHQLIIDHLGNCSWPLQEFVSQRKLPVGYIIAHSSDQQEFLFKVLQKSYL
jgi:hypothetical protein